MGLWLLIILINNFFHFSPWMMYSILIIHTHFWGEVSDVDWRRAWPPTPIFLPGKSHGQRSLEGYGPGGHKETDMTDVTKQDLDEVRRVRPQWRDEWPYKRRKEPQRSLHHVRTQQEGSCLQVRKGAPTRTWPCWHHDLRLPIFRTVRK